MLRETAVMQHIQLHSESVSQAAEDGECDVGSWPGSYLDVEFPVVAEPVHRPVNLTNDRMKDRQRARPRPTSRVLLEKVAGDIEAQSEGIKLIKLKDGLHH